jgi:transcriptional regulator with XRE-family HTH domain
MSNTLLDSHRLRRELLRRGLTQGHLATLSGVRQETISRAVNGRRVATRTLAAIAAALTAAPIVGMSLDLVADDDEE